MITVVVLDHEALATVIAELLAQSRSMKNMQDDWSPYDWSLLPHILQSGIMLLSDADRARVANAEPGSTRLCPVGHGWISVTVGVKDPVHCGEFHLSALTEAGSTLQGSQN